MITNNYVSYSFDALLPEARITVNKNRLKQHGETIYMQDGTEFEIELFNPKNTKVLAKIKINGNYISNGGLVLKPGQRIFLERFLETNKKFLFETYQVEGNNQTVANAIKNNGDVVIEFYDEETIISYPNYNWSTFNVNTITNGNVGTYFTNTSTMPSDNFLSFDNSINKRNFSKKIETGTVEQGSKSDQIFSEVNYNFNSYTCNVERFKLLPKSQEPITYKPMKQYCVGCGTKLNNKWQFCSSCGKKIK